MDSRQPGQSAGYKTGDTGNTGDTGDKSTEQSWLERFLHNRPLISRVIGRIVRPDEIEDIVQETFVQSYTAARHQKINNPRAFMLRTAKNIALNHINRSDRKLSCAMEDTLNENLATQIDTVESECQSEERFSVFCRAVAELPVSCRRVFILKKVYGLSQKEIAAFLGISASTVEKHIAKGMAMTTQFMMKEGHPVAVRKTAKNSAAGMRR